MTDINYPALALATFLFAATPGPGIVAILAVAVSRGAAMGTAMSLGLVCGDMAYLLVAIASLAGIAHWLEGAMEAVRVAGGLYIAWLGYRQMRSPPLEAGEAPIDGRGLWVAWAGGFAITITNPKVVVFYLSFLPLFVDLGRLGGGQAAAVVAVMAASVLAAPLLVVAMAGRARDLVTGEVSGRLVNRATGAMLVAAGVALVALA